MFIELGNAISATICNANNGRLRNLKIGYWLFLVGYWLFLVGYWLFLVGYWLFLVGYWLFRYKNLYFNTNHLLTYNSALIILNPAVESGAQTQFIAPQQLATQFDGPQRIRLHCVASPCKTNSCISTSTSTADLG